MASIFEQYDKTLKRESISTGISNTGFPSSGIVSVRVKEDTPIFSKRKMNLTTYHDILQVVVSKGNIIVLQNNYVLLRIDIVAKTSNEITLEKFMAGLHVLHMFQDPLGAHLFVSLTSRSGPTSDLLYLHRQWSRPRKLDKLKDHEITAIAFNLHNQLDNTTNSILLGTNRGLIFECEIQVDGEKLIHNCKQVFEIGSGENVPITGIEFYKIKKTYIVIVTTKDRFYKFSETVESDDKPLYLTNVFNSYLNAREQANNFELIANRLNYSKLQLSYGLPLKTPTALGWLIEMGIYFGEINSSIENKDILISNKIIPYPDFQEENYSTYMKAPQKAPISFILTDFHVILLYPDHVTAISVLNHQTVYKEHFAEQFGKLLNIVKDTNMNTFYVYTSKCIFLYNINNEHRNVWQMYTEQNKFDLAKQYCIDNPAHMDIVLVKEAELLFTQKKYIESAFIYSQTHSSFEEICLKFLELNENDALMTFLKNRLEKLDAQDKTQITMLVVWMVELYLTEIARCVDNKPRITKLQTEYDNFTKIPRVVECMRNNRSVIYDLMASHADNHNLTALTTVNRDYESVMNQYINQNKFVEALSVLKAQNKPDLYYKYSPILMENIPKETISAIMAQGKHLNVIKLLPTLVSIESEKHVAEIISYLEFSIYSMGCIEPSIHNYIIKLYGQYKNDKLLSYLEYQGKDVTMIYYDIHYALRICSEHSMLEACVFLQCLLEMWLPAVELSLTFNTELAQRTASMPSDANLKRKLWLKIAEHKIKQNNDVAEAVDLIKKGDSLKIEDLLPFFSDFVKIDDFKDLICDALKEYNLKIQEQRKDMEESAKSAERVRNELQSLRNRSITISATEQCSICEVYLFLKPFFIFPCGHKFHSDCLEKNLMVIQTSEENRKFISLKQKLAILSIQQNDNENDKKTGSTREQIKSEIEDILTEDCIFCGDRMIDTIDQPFVEDWNNVNIGWD